MEMLYSFFSFTLLIAAVRMATPLLLASLGGMFSERSGVINIGLEGMMLMGAFGAVAVALITSNPWLGVIAAGLVGGIMGAIHAVMSIKFKANQIISATGINIMAAGLPGVLLLRFWGKLGNSPSAPQLSSITLPFNLGSYSPLTILAFLLVPVAHFVLYKTDFGLHIRAVGNHPKAADTVGINVYLVRYVCVIISGAMAGLGGAYLSLSQLSMFSQNMTAGRGFIALAALIFGKYTPIGCLGASLLFGLADGIQMFAQARGIPLPHDFLLMTPYILTMVALAGFIGNANPPKASGKPYEK